MTDATHGFSVGAPVAARPMRIANVSGFYGDRLAAPKEMLDGPDPIDVMTGDYLAELTMLLLWKARQRDPAAGFARTFVSQAEQVLARAIERGVRIVTNAGGLNPRGLAAALGDVAARLGVPARIAVVEGDDLTDRLDQLQRDGVPLTNLDTGVDLAASGHQPLTANAYLGGWAIAEALAKGADVVVTGRVTDASLVVGPAAWWHGWRRDDWDALAGAVVVGHILECGAQATGGNYSFLDDIVDRRYPGFPIAHVRVDGSAVITKQPDTGGVVSVGTVTAQLLYELGAPDYANPDVVARFDTIRLRAEAENRVEVSGVRGTPPPGDLKVAINFDGGYRNTMTMVLTGLDIEAKATHATSLLFEILGGRDQFADVTVHLIRSDQADAATNEEAMAQLRITVKDPDPRKVGRRFSSAVIELALAGYAGFFTTTPPGSETAFGIYWPTLVPAVDVEQHLVIGDEVVRVAHTAELFGSLDDGERHSRAPSSAPSPTLRAIDVDDTVRRPLGAACGARSGDKGGNANVGFWTWDADLYSWLAGYLTVDRLRLLLSEAKDLAVDRYELPNLLALNFVVHGILGEGVAASTRVDAQAKGLGEYIRSRVVDIPAQLVPRLRD